MMTQRRLYKILDFPKHLQATMLTLIKLGRGTAQEVANVTGKERAVESAYLNQLAVMQIVQERTAGAQSCFHCGFGGAGLVKGKPWDINEERQLRQLVEEGKTVDAICKMMVKTHDAVAQKMFDLKLSV